MGTYQGPNVSVRQQFVVSPGAVAVESLPSVAVATAYDVYNKQSLGTFYGIGQKDDADHTTDLLWGTSNKVVYNESIAGKRAFDFYPPAAYANSLVGQIDLALDSTDFSSNGVAIARDEMYVLPNTEKVAGSCQAILPYYNAVLTTGDVTISATSLNIISIIGGAIVTAQLKPGQRVFIHSGSSWLDVGIIGSIGNDETKIFLSKAYSVDITDGDKIIVGCASNDLPNYPEVLYDASADFIAAKVKVGDIISLSSLAISGSINDPELATVTAIINKHTLRFNTEALGAGHADSDYLKYKAFATSIGSTIQLYSYSINRLVGFSQSYGLKRLHGNVGVKISSVSSTKTSFKIPKTITLPTTTSTTPAPSDNDVPALNKGDLFIITAANTASSAEERDTTYKRIYAIDTISFDGTYYTITTITAMNRSGVSGDTPIATGDFIQAWQPMVTTEIISDFRAIRSEEHNVVKRITSVKDIRDAWVRSDDQTIDPRNELAFMMNIIFGRSGGKVCYGVNVDSSDSLATEYENALEELKLFDVYSHCFGTTDAGVNGIIGAYCDEQSEPYEAHERIGVICYDLDDIYLMGNDTGSINKDTGVITLHGSFNPLSAGLTTGDKVQIYSVTAYITTATVTSTPTVVTTVNTDYVGDAVTTPSFKFESGRKDDQANRGGSIKYGNRRVGMVWPGWFSASYGNENLLVPPYFIAASVCGMDGGVIVSQSLTNMPFSIPGLSNIQLGTNTYFRKAQLDEIGGGGVDIMIQDATITPTIRSRHDLTTNMDAVQYRERSITKQADVCAKTVRSAVAPYVGRYNINDPNLFKFLGQVCSIVCTKLVTDGIIAKLTVDKIERDAVIDDKINFFLTATAFIAGNYYDITLLVKTR